MEGTSMTACAELIVYFQPKWWQTQDSGRTQVSQMSGHSVYPSQVDIKKSAITLVITGFPCGSDYKESICLHCGRPGSIPGSERSPGKGNSYPLQYSCWEIPRTEKPGELQSMGSQRVGHNWETEHMHAISWDMLVRHLMNFSTAGKSM